MTTRAKPVPAHIQRELDRMGAEAGRVRQRAKKPAGTFTRKPHVRKTPAGLVAVKRSKRIARWGQHLDRAREAPLRAVAAAQALTAQGSRRDQLKFGAKLAGSAAVVTGVGAGQVLSFTVSVLAAVVVLIATFAWYITRKVEPKKVRRFRTRWMKVSKAVKAELRHQAQLTAQAYRGTRSKTTARGRRV